MKLIVLVLLFLGLIQCFIVPPAHGCNVCHSKNPKMVKMHRELEFKDCFTCHGKDLKKSPQEKKQQRETDSRCTRCHNR